MSDIREAFEALNKYRKAYDEMYQMLGIFLDADEGLEKPDIDEAWAAFNLAPGPVYWKAIEAALSANGGEAVPVAWVVFADNGNIRIWGREKPEAFPEAVPLYLSPTVKDFLTVQGEPIGYADPDSLNDYRAGDRLHMPVYRPDASADWQDGVPVYLHPAPPSVAVPEGDLRERITNLLCSLGHQGVDMGEGQLYDIGEWGIKEAQELHTLLTAAPSLDHSGDANKMVDVECCCENPEPEEGPAMVSDCCPIHNVFPQHCENCAQDDGHDHIADAGKVVPSDWEGWACHKAGKMPRLYGEKSIAEVNCDTENGERLIFLSAAPSVPENEILLALDKWVRIKADFEDFDGDRRGIAECLRDAEQELRSTHARLRTAGDKGEGV